MKKVLYIFLDILTVAFLIGSYVIQYFAKKRLGMIRWVNFKQMKIKESLPVDMLKYVALVAAVLLTLFIVRQFLKKRREMKKTDTVMLAILIILCAVYFVVTVFMSGSILAYYLVLPLIGLAVLAQIIRNALVVWS